MNKSILPMDLQYFAEGDDNGAGQNPDGSNTGTQRNVSADQFKSLANTVKGFGDTLSKLNDYFSNQSVESTPSSAANPNSAASSASDSASGANGTDWQAKLDAQQKIIDSLTANQSATSVATTKASLATFAQETAKSQGVSLGSVVDRLVGKDQEETKAAVEAFVKTVKANTSSTDNGFHLSDANGTVNNPQDYMKGFLERKFGKNK